VLAQAASISFNNTFETRGQSMWNSGAAYTYSYTPRATVTWNESGSGGGIWCDPIFGSCYGGTVSGRTDGEIGLGFGVRVSAGSVDTSTPVNMTFATPDARIVPGASFDVTSSYSWGTGSFSTTGPHLEAWTDFIFDVYASGRAGGCVIWCANTGNVTFLDIDQEIELLGFNRNNDGELRLLGIPQGFGSTLDLGYVEAVVGAPRGPDTSGTGVGTTAVPN
jgi:hypothetical protein